MSIPSYSQIVHKEIRERLKKMYFKRRKYFHVYSNDGNNYLSIHANGLHSYSSEFIMDIFVGVSIGSVNRLYAQLTERECDIETFIIGGQIGFIMPEQKYIQWRMNRAMPCTPYVDNMMESIQKYAFPYYEKMKDLNTMLNIVELRKGISNDRRDYYYPVMLYLAGRKEEGLRHIERVLDIERYHGPNLERYMLFYNNYKKLLASGKEVSH